MRQSWPDRASSERKNGDECSGYHRQTPATVKRADRDPRATNKARRTIRRHIRGEMTSPYRGIHRCKTNERITRDQCFAIGGISSVIAMQMTRLMTTDVIERRIYQRAGNGRGVSPSLGRSARNTGQDRRVRTGREVIAIWSGNEAKARRQTG